MVCLQVLSHLVDVRVEVMQGEDRGFKLFFEFEKNKYFDNKVGVQAAGAAHCGACAWNGGVNIGNEVVIFPMLVACHETCRDAHAPGRSSPHPLHAIPPVTLPTLVCRPRLCGPP